MAFPQNDSLGDDSVERGPTGEPPVQYHAPIREWDEEDRPREKLLQHGPQVLSDAELMALVIGTGTRTDKGPVSAVELSRTLTRTYGSLGDLARRDGRSLTRVRGIGPAKAARLLAAFEIGRRIEAAGADEHVHVSSPEEVARIYGPLMRDLGREVFKVVLLNTANGIIGDHTVSTGGLAASIVEPRAVFQKAILENAAAVICLHNHPSGNDEPSKEDLKVTRQLARAGELMGIPLHDHLIIAGRSYTSLAERGAI